MALYRKDENGRVSKTAGNLVQRWNDRIFLTTHSVVEDKDYYDIETAANKFITGLTDFTEFQLYITEPNETPDVYIRFGGKELQLMRSDEDPIAIGFLFRRMSFYTLATDTGIIWKDALLQPTPDTYRGIFVYAVQTWDPTVIPGPQVGETAIALDTNNTYEYDGVEWDITGVITEQLNGWHWLIEFFPDYFFGNGKIVWNGGSEAWNIYTARTSRPDEDTIVTNLADASFKIAKLPNNLVFGEGFAETAFDGSVTKIIKITPSIDTGNRIVLGTDDLIYTRAPHADETAYENILSGLSGDTVQEAIDELIDITKTITENDEDQDAEILEIKTIVGTMDTIPTFLRQSTLTATVNQVWLDLRTRILNGFKKVGATALGWEPLIDGGNRTFPVPAGVTATGFFLVFVNGLMRQFTTSGNNITLEEAPPVNSIITAAYLDNSVFAVGG